MIIKNLFISFFLFSISFSSIATSVYENNGNITEGTHSDGSKSKSVTIGNTTTVERYGIKSTYVQQGKFTIYTDAKGNQIIYNQVGDTVYGKDQNGLEITITKTGNKTVVKRSDGKSVTCTNENNISKCVNN